MVKSCVSDLKSTLVVNPNDFFQANDHTSVTTLDAVNRFVKVDS